MGRNVGIIGGGAAGFFCGIHVKSQDPEARVTIYEASSKALTKVKISGGGRCNVTNHNYNTDEFCRNYPRGERFMKQALKHFQAKDTMGWFESRGIHLKTEKDGRVFPTTDNSESIVNCLLQEADKLGVELKLKHRVKEIRTTNEGYELFFKEKASESFDQIVVASGSAESIFPLIQELGVKVLDRIPSLFTFKAKDPRIADLSGVAFEKVKCQLKIEGLKKPFEFTGPVLITHWGFSGPGILKLSAWGARELYKQGYSGRLILNYLPEYHQDQLVEELYEYKSNQSKVKIKNLKFPPLPKRFFYSLLNHLNIEEDKIMEEVSKKDIRKIAEECCAGQYNILGKGVFKEEFVTSGGVDLKELKKLSMESKRCPGLFFAGEVLDVDGITGGFNLQNAWTSGYLAAQGVLSV